MMNLVGGSDFTNVEKHSFCFNSYWWSGQFTETDLLDAAANLGSSPWQRFRYVIFPLP